MLVNGSYDELRVSRVPLTHARAPAGPPPEAAAGGGVVRIATRPGTPHPLIGVGCAGCDLTIPPIIIGIRIFRLLEGMRVHKHTPYNCNQMYLGTCMLKNFQ